MVVKKKARHVLTSKAKPAKPAARPAKRDEESGGSSFQPDEQWKIKTIRVSDSTDLKVVINQFGERNLVDMRQWYSKKGNPTKLPGKGMSFNLALLDEVIAALQKTKRIALKNNLTGADTPDE